MERSRGIPLHSEDRRCLVCGSAEASGFLVRGERICGPCGDKITLLRAGDPEYEFYKERLKRLWPSRSLRGEGR